MAKQRSAVVEVVRTGRLLCRFDVRNLTGDIGRPTPQRGLAIGNRRRAPLEASFPIGAHEMILKRLKRLGVDQTMFHLGNGTSRRRNRVMTFVEISLKPRIAGIRA